MMDESSSGVVESLDGHIDSTFTNISLLFSSSHSELRVAQRYGRRFVLKSLPQSYRGVPVYEAQLEKEFNISILMNHPNVVQTIGFEVVPGLGNTIIMEYVDGFTLNEWLKGNPSEQQRYDVLSQLLDGVSYIHSHQVIHRDLKPRNILVTRNGQHVKVIDFGLSDTDSYAIFKQPAGTKRYVSPEQQQSGQSVDQRSDIYSLGVVISDLFPRKYSSIVKKCCAQDPLRRFANVAQLREALGKSRNWVWLVVLFILLLGVLVGILLYSKVYPRTGNSAVDEPNTEVVNEKEVNVEEGGLPTISTDSMMPVGGNATPASKTQRMENANSRNDHFPEKGAARADRLEKIRIVRDSNFKQQKRKYEALKRSSICREEVTSKSSIVNCQFVLWYYKSLISFDRNSVESQMFYGLFDDNDRLFREAFSYMDSLPPLNSLYENRLVTETERDSILQIVANESKVLKELGDSLFYWHSKVNEPFKK